MNKKDLVSVFILVGMIMSLMIIGGVYYFLKKDSHPIIPVATIATESKNISQSEENIVSKNETASPAKEIPTITAGDTTPNINQSWGETVLYANAKFEYSLLHPSDWIVEPEQQIMIGPNRIQSLVRIHDTDNTHVMSITVNEKEWMLKFEAPIKDELIVNNSNETAYLFPLGYECIQSDPNGKDCSFFVVPIFRNGIWYEIRASGDVIKERELYENILSTFTFSSSSKSNQED